MSQQCNCQPSYAKWPPYIWEYVEQAERGLRGVLPEREHYHVHTRTPGKRAVLKCWVLALPLVISSTFWERRKLSLTTFNPDPPFPLFSNSVTHNLPKSELCSFLSPTAPHKMEPRQTWTNHTREMATVRKQKWYIPISWVFEGQAIENPHGKTRAAFRCAFR